MSLVDLDFGNKVPAGAAAAVGAAAAARNYVVKPRLGVWHVQGLLLRAAACPAALCHGLLADSVGGGQGPQRGGRIEWRDLPCVWRASAVAVARAGAGLAVVQPALALACSRVGGSRHRLGAASRLRLAALPRGLAARGSRPEV